MRASFRNRILFVDHDTVFPADPNAPVPKKRLWFTYQTDEPGKQWIVEATNRSAEHAAFYRSMYMRWAITINALNVARDRYAEPPRRGLQILHVVPGGDGPEVQPLDIWEPETSVANYTKSIPLMAAYGIQDLFGTMEEIIFDLYEIYLDAHPLEILEGPDFREQRRLHRERNDSPEKVAAWSAAWADRMTGWRRKRIYDGLHRVFRAFWERSGLKRSSAYTGSDIDDWCRTIETISELRNLLVHGENQVSPRLGDLVAAQPYLGMTFVANEVLEVCLMDIMIVERFFTDMIIIINESLMELAADGRPFMSMGRDSNREKKSSSFSGQWRRIAVNGRTHWWFTHRSTTALVDTCPTPTFLSLRPSCGRSASPDPFSKEDFRSADERDRRRSHSER